MGKKNIYEDDAVMAALLSLGTHVEAEQSASKRNTIEFVGELFTEAFSRLDDHEAEIIYSLIEEKLGVDLGDDDVSLDDVPIVTNNEQYAPKKPKFGLQTYDECLEDACWAAGGVWVESPASGYQRGCYTRKGSTKTERAAVAALYLVYAQQCWWELMGSPVSWLINKLGL